MKTYEAVLELIGALARLAFFGMACYYSMKKMETTAIAILSVCMYMPKEKR